MCSNIQSRRLKYAWTYFSSVRSSRWRPLALRLVKSAVRAIALGPQYIFILSVTLNYCSVHIEDVNDNPPVLHIPSECTTITEFHNYREPIVSVSATDADDNSAPNGRVQFHLVGGKGHGKVLSDLTLFYFVLSTTKMYIMEPVFLRVICDVHTFLY